MREVKEAVWTCDVSKSPRFDGFSFNCIKKMWGVIGDGFIKQELDFFNKEKLPDGVNVM